MPIDSRMLVNVYPSIIQPGATDLEVNGLVLTRNASIPISRVSQGMLQFFSPADVAVYFGGDSDEYAFSQVYFSGYTGAWKAPSRLIFARYNDTAAPAWIRGDPLVATIADFKTLDAADLTVDFSGTSIAITPVNLSVMESYTQIADALQAAIRAAGTGNEQAATATVTYDTILRAFTITAGGAGANGQTVTVEDGALADMMLLSTASNPTLSDGSDAIPPAQIMENIRGVAGNWATFTTLWAATIDEMLMLARWQAETPVSYLYCPWDDDENGHLREPNSTDDSATILSGISADVGLVFGAGESGLPGSAFAAFEMAIAASIDFSAFRGMITFAHKQQEGLSFNVTDTATARALDAKGVNFYGNFATRNAEFLRFYPGRTLGAWRWMDHYIGGVWFMNALNNAAMYGLGSSPIIPYNTDGLGIVESIYMQPIKRAINNGVITPGLALSDTQRAEIIREAGTNIIPDLQMYGYYLQVRAPEPSVRMDRGSTVNILWYTFAGSVHKLDLRAVSLA